MAYVAQSQVWEAKKAAIAFAARQLQDANPHLAANDGNSLTTAAKNVRIELKRAFPGISFQVRSKRFSGGNDLRVSWIDGPNKQQVEAIIKAYSAGDFDGMTDSYDYRKDRAFTEAFGCAKYVFAERQYSDAAIASAIRTVTNRYRFDGIAPPSVEDYRMGRCWNASPIMGGDLQHRSDWGSLISQELSRRTWAITKRA